MNNIKINIIGAIAVIGLIVGVMAFIKMPSNVSSTSDVTYGAISNTNAPAANTVQINGNLLPNPSVLDYIVARSFLYFDKAIGFGNSSGTAILQQATRVAITASSSIICSMQNPFTASSTFEFALTVASTSANTSDLVLATANTALATTTVYGQKTLTANAQLTWATQGTTTAGNTSGVVGPSKFLNVGGTAGADTMLAQLGGTCEGIWTSTN